jgi:hypothetical protein
VLTDGRSTEAAQIRGEKLTSASERIVHFDTGCVIEYF